MRFQIAIIEGLLLLLALLGLGAGIVVFAITLQAGAAMAAPDHAGAQALGATVGGLYAASPALIVGVLSLVGYGVMSAVERSRQTAVELATIAQQQRMLGR